MLELFVLMGVHATVYIHETLYSRSFCFSWHISKNLLSFLSGPTNVWNYLAASLPTLWDQPKKAIYPVFSTPCSIYRIILGRDENVSKMDVDSVDSVDRRPERRPVENVRMVDVDQ